ncbi:MAG: hypothetical protein NC319_09445 [Butyricicoccus sp.]|nr:hypothetical protein [Butyricicoccus sp.]
MGYMADPCYSLRYDREGREKEKNRISPLLTAPEYSIGEVNKVLRPQFETMRKAIEISRRHRYDLDISTSFLALNIAIYRKSPRFFELSFLMPLFDGAFSVGMESFSFGRIFALKAFYLFPPEKEQDAKGSLGE